MSKTTEGCLGAPGSTSAVLNNNLMRNKLDENE